MAQIGTLTTGAGVTTVITGQTQCEQFLLIGDVDTANPLQGLQVEIDGKAFINISNAASLITAYMKWQMESCAGTIGLLIKIGTGSIRQNTTYRLTNAGVTTPNIFAFSAEQQGVPFEVSTATINPSSYLDFSAFSAIFLQTPANVAGLEFTFTDGTRSTLTPTEADALFALYNQAETDGRLGGVTVIDNTQQTISNVRVNTNSTAGGCTVLQAKLPDAAWAALKNG